jgi:hypothetical protein
MGVITVIRRKGFEKKTGVMTAIRRKDRRKQNRSSERTTG